MMDMIKRIITKRSAKTGAPPGTLIHVGERKMENPRITVIDYNEKIFDEKQIEEVEECIPFKNRPTITWVNVDGLHDVSIIEKLGKCFNFHPLLLEDILSTEQRPKMADFGDYIFIIMKMLRYDASIDKIISEQVSVILGPSFVISFQEADNGDVFDLVRDRIRKGKGKIRKMGADYLAYTLMDAIVDQYFIIMEKVGEKFGGIEEDLVYNPTKERFRIAHELKRDVLLLRRYIWPLREVISGLERSESPLIKNPTKIYLRDVYEHAIQVIDTIEIFREMTASMLEVSLSSISNNMNEVMKVLTLIATIFMPLTFIAGVYGMNFRYMPELEMLWGYEMVWAIMISVVIIMLAYFRKRKWI